MDDTKQDALRMLIKNLLGMPYGSVRPSTNQPAEGDSYIIVKESDYNIMGQAGSGVGARQSGTVVFTIECMGDNAASNAKQINLAMRTDEANEELTVLGLGFISCNQPKNLTALEMDQIERWQVKLTLSFVEKYILEPNPEDIPIIESVPVGIFAEP